MSAFKIGETVHMVELMDRVVGAIGGFDLNAELQRCWGGIERTVVAR